jgi:hypothetical protein
MAGERTRLVLNIIGEHPPNLLSLSPSAAWLLQMPANTGFKGNTTRQNKGRKGKIT